MLWTKFKSTTFDVKCVCANRRNDRNLKLNGSLEKNLTLNLFSANRFPNMMEPITFVDINESVFYFQLISAYLIWPTGQQ